MTLRKISALTSASVACWIVASAGCHKPDLDKARMVLRRWDRGWLDARTCMLGGTERTPDVALQIDLHALLDEPVLCSQWIRDASAIPQGRGIEQIGSNGKDWMQKYENAHNIWTELDPDDLDDASAAAALDLDDAVVALQKCGVSRCKDLADRFTAVATRRGALAVTLDLPPTENPEIAKPVKVIDVAVIPVPTEGSPIVVDLGKTGDGPINAHWKLTKAPGAKAPIYTVTSDTGKTQTLEVGVDEAVNVIRDDASPILWIHPIRTTDDFTYMRVFQLHDDTWSWSDMGPFLFATTAKRRFDVVSGDLQKDAVVWRSFVPGEQLPPVVQPTTGFDFDWACGTEEVFWEGFRSSSDDGGSQVVRWQRGKPPALPARTTIADPDVRLDANDRVVCDDRAVFVNGSLLCRDGGSGCTHAGAAIGRPVLFDGDVVSVDAMPVDPADPRRQLVAVRGDRNLHVVRLPAGARLMPETARSYAGRLIADVAKASKDVNPKSIGVVALN